MTAGFFRVPERRVSEIDECFERAENGISFSKSDAKPSRLSNLLVLPEEKRRVMAWIEDCQRERNCHSPREVRDFVSILYPSRTGQERFLNRDWWQKFPQRHQEKLTVNRVAAKEPQQAAVAAKAVIHYFEKLREVLPNCVSPNQILKMDETGLSVRSLKVRDESRIFEDLSRDSIISRRERCHSCFTRRHTNFW
jgi:hypothetical protein